MDEKATPNETKKTTAFREIFSWVFTVVLAFAVAFFITHVLIVNAQVPTPSMESTIMVNDRLVANRLAYVAHDPERFDIVVFPCPDEPDKLYIKRIIGLPGDTVEVKDGKVFINGEQIDDAQYVANATGGVPTGNYGPYEVPAASYFMMGDNRNDSWDARFWKNTYVARDEIQGKAVFKYWPLPFGKLN